MYLEENSLYTTDVEKQAILADKSAIAESFLFNFFGILGLINATKPVQRQILLNYLKKDKRVRLSTITDENHDISLSFKLAADAGFFRDQATPLEITKFLFKLKTGQIHFVQSKYIFNWAEKLTPLFKMSLDSKERLIFKEFMDGQGITVDVSHFAVKLKVRANKSKYSGEFRTYAKQFGAIKIRTTDEINLELKGVPVTSIADIQDNAPKAIVAPIPVKPVYNVSTHEFKLPFIDANRVIGLFDTEHEGLLSTHFKKGNEMFDNKMNVESLKTASRRYFQRQNSANPELEEELFQRFKKVANYSSLLFQKLDTKLTLAEIQSEILLFIDQVDSLKIFDSKDTINRVYFTYYGSMPKTYEDIILKTKDVNIYYYLLINHRDSRVFQSFTGNINPPSDVYNKFAEEILESYFNTEDKVKFLSNYLKFLNEDKSYKISKYSKLKFDTFFNLVYFSKEIIFKNDKSFSASLGIENLKNLINDINTIDFLLPEIKDFYELKLKEFLKFDTTVNSEIAISKLNYNLSNIDYSEKAKKYLDPLLKKSVEQYISNHKYNSNNTNLIPYIYNNRNSLLRFLEIDQKTIIETALKDPTRKNQFRDIFVTSVLSNEIKFSDDVLEENLDFLFLSEGQHSDNFYISSNISSLFSASVINSKLKKKSIDLLLEKIKNGEVTSTSLSRYSNFTKALVSTADSEMITHFLRKCKELGFTTDFFDPNRHFEDISRRDEKREYSAVVSTLLQLSIGTDIEDWFNDIFEIMPGGVVRQVRESVVGVQKLKKILEEGDIKTFKKLDNSEMRRILLMNDLDLTLLSGTKERKKKNETWTQYFKRELENSDDTFTKPKISNLKENPIETTKLYNKTMHAGRHGNKYAHFLKSFDVGIKSPEFDTFRKETPGDGTLFPVFHSCGGIAANMILRFGFKIIRSSDPLVTGRMLGDGIYFTPNIDKSIQYLSNSGYSQQTGEKGYVLECDITLGERNKYGPDYDQAGTGNDRIRSPEYRVSSVEKQIHIVKAYETELATKEILEKRIGSLNENFQSYKSYLMEAKAQEKKMSFRFRDGMIPILKKTGKKIFLDFEDVIKKYPKLATIMEYTMQGPSLVFPNAAKDVSYDIRFGEHMRNDEVLAYDMCFRSFMS